MNVEVTDPAIEALNPIHSSLREKMLETVFLAELSRALWRKGRRDFDVLRAEVDRGGYDVMVECGGVMRHIQLKSTHRSFGDMRIDRAVGVEVIERLQPLGIEAAIGAMEACRAENAEKQRQLDLALEQARYEAALARRQYDAVDPDNRRVAAELERRRNERLVAVDALENEQNAVMASPRSALTAVERERLLGLGADVTRAWNSPGATPQTRKRIIRTLRTGSAAGR